MNECGQALHWREEESARGKAIVGLLGDHESNKKSQYNDFSRKVQFREINLKQLLVIKTLESVRYLPCTSPCYAVGKAFRHVDGAGALCSHIRSFCMLTLIQIIAG